MEQNFLLKRLKQGDPEAFTMLFRQYYKDLVLFGGNFLKNQMICEDIVQSVFLRLWNEKESLEIKTSLKSYLLKSVQNSCLDEIRHQKIVHDHEAWFSQYATLYEIDTENYILYSDLYNRLQEVLGSMPEEYRIAFEMNRFEGLKYHEIAVQLNVSVRTIEVRISKALKILKKELKDFLPMLFFMGIA